MLVSAYGLHLEQAGNEALARTIDRWSLAVLPILFFGWATWAIWRSVGG